MKILIAPNSMKGSLNAFDFAEVVEKAFLSVSGEFEIRKLPVADGGDYTGKVLSRSLNADNIVVSVHGPLGEIVQSGYSIADKTAIIEMADASGMKLVDSKLLNPLKASSFGMGQLINDAVEKGCATIFLAIGGSATVDGGTGMLEALGFSFLGKNNEKLTGKGENLSKIRTIQKPDNLANISFKVICDVDNPLLGEKGAATVFGPQKGATPEMVVQLEKGLANWVEVVRVETGKDLKHIESGGAAGGVAIPLIAFFDAEIVRGADFILKQLNFEESVKWADLVITGEGKIDSQTLNNKAPFAVARIARENGKPVFALGGQVEKSKEIFSVFDEIFSLTTDQMDLEYAIKNAKQLLFNVSAKLAKSINCLNE